MNPLFNLKGIVIKGKNRGIALGFPTANIKISKTIPIGIYAALTSVRGKIYPSVFFAGAAETFNESEILGESYIIGFDKFIYGEEINVKAIRKLRGSQKFKSTEDLKKQMKVDEKQAMKFLKDKY